MRITPISVEEENVIDNETTMSLEKSAIVFFYHVTTNFLKILYITNLNFMFIKNFQGIDSH